MSDWCSDVCSSDLTGWPRRSHAAEVAPVPPAAAVARAAALVADDMVAGMTTARNENTGAGADAAGPDRPRRVQLSCARGFRLPSNTVKVDRSTRWGNPYNTRFNQIGRASCSERVCQYV